MHSADRSKNIVLVGFMASGKTRVSQALAQALGRERVSTDEMIEQKEGRAIADIFAVSGEPYFRCLEAKVVKACAARTDLVIDCGGGVAVHEDNFNALKKTGIIFYLEASPEAVHRRTKGRTDRPLLNVADPLARIRELLAKRDPHYRKAHHVVDSNEDNIAKVVHEILGILSSDRT